MPGAGENGRSWWVDALTSLAFFGNALFLGKFAARAAGFLAGLFVLLVSLGLAYHFGRAAWRGLLGARER